jgi:membrane protein
MIYAVWRLAQNVYTEIVEDRVLAVAAGVAFYGLLALFPAITTLVSFYGIFNDRSTAAADLATLTSLLPPSAVSIVSDQINRIINTGSVNLSLAAAFSFLIAIWSANSGMKAAMDALNVAYGVKETRSFLTLNALSLFFTFSAIFVLLFLLSAIALVPVILEAIGLGPWVEWLIWLGRWPLLLLAANLALAVLYRWGPAVSAVKWRWYSPGTIFASLGFALLSVAFSAYAANFAQFNETYGSLGAVIAFLTWSWLVTVIMLTGAELNAELDRMAKAASNSDAQTMPVTLRRVVK